MFSTAPPLQILSVLLHTCKFAYFTLISEVMYLRMAVWTKTWGGEEVVVVTGNLYVFSVGHIVMPSNIFGILQAAIPHITMI